MPSIQSLKKELRGIRSTQKLTKAMRTVSAAKFSKLNVSYGQYSEYGKACKKVFDEYQASFLEAIPAANPEAPPVFLVMASNKGLCGSFNAEVLKFAYQELLKQDSFLLVAYGKKAIRFFKEKGLPMEQRYLPHDLPTYQECSMLLRDLLSLRRTGSASEIYVIYPKYVNMLEQVPTICSLFPGTRRPEPEADRGSVLCVPDKRTVITETAETLFCSMFYELALESALGAQAATLMTMRAAYDAATEFCAQLENEINHNRQSAVTADVIETSSGEAARPGNG